MIFFFADQPAGRLLQDVGFISLADPDTALRAVALSSVWQNLGLTFIIVLAGLQAVPEEILRGGHARRLRPGPPLLPVTLPLISPTLMFLVVVLVIFAFQAFAQIDILTGGGPAGSTETLVFKIFQSQQPRQITVGSVMAVGLFVLTLVVTLLQFLILDRRVHYGDDVLEAVGAEPVLGSRRCGRRTWTLRLVAGTSCSPRCRSWCSSRST